MRVQTTSTIVLPITLRGTGDFSAYESQAQLLQGMFFGLALCMLLYSLAHWASLRDTLRVLAHTDPLTGLPNRRGLQIHLGAALRDAAPQREQVYAAG
jgi:GGDEF domain-containing protein